MTPDCPNALNLDLGLSKRTTTEGLKGAFEQFGEVVHAKVVTDRVSGYSKGFGFVKYATLEDAAKAIEGMDGKVGFLIVFLFFFMEASILELFDMEPYRSQDQTALVVVSN
ncbi:Organelle RRM domain-containing protein 2, mitochondrial [Linum grandiflorum]